MKVEKVFAEGEVEMTYPYPLRVDWEEQLEYADDLDKVKKALIRESAIRHVMEATGETREVVVSVVDANVSMGHEAVLDLTEGEPTTLRDALRSYVDDLAGRDELSMQQEGAQGFRDSVVGDLHTLMDHPWPGDR